MECKDCDDYNDDDNDDVDDGVDHNHRRYLDRVIAGMNIDPSKLSGITGTEAMRRVAVHEESKRQHMLQDPKKRNRPITFTPRYTSDNKGNEYLTIDIDTHEDDHVVIRFSPGMSDHDWKFEFDPETHEYRYTSGTWLETIKQNGAVPLWKRGEGYLD